MASKIEFEQAFYTWGEKEKLLNASRTGLGVCASSSTQENFLNNVVALELGSYIPEGIDRSAQFVVYSNKWKCFVSLGLVTYGISADNRPNRLIHVIVPKSPEEQKQPEDYLLDYPFQTNLGDEEVLSPLSIQRKQYNYREILETFGFDQDKMAVLFKQLYNYIFSLDSGLKKMVFIIDKNKHSEDEYAQIASNIMWLINQWFADDVLQNEKWRSKMTYCVHSYKNIENAKVSFVFSDDVSLKENPKMQYVYCLDEYVHLDAENWQSSTSESKLFRAMAATALEGKENVKAFLNRLYEQKRPSKDTTVADWIMADLKYKMDLGQKVTIEELEEVKKLRDVCESAIGSTWYRQFLYEYIYQTDSLSESSLKIWKYFFLKSFDGRQKEGVDKDHFIDALCRIVDETYKMNTKHYHTYLSKIPKAVKQDVLPVLYEREDYTCIRKDFEMIEDVEQLEAFDQNYLLLLENTDMRRDFIDRAKEIYIESDKARKGELNQHFKNHQNQQVKKEWKDYIDGQLLAYTNVFELFDFLNTDFGEIEESCLEGYYKLMLDFAKDAKSIEEKQCIFKIQNQFSNCMELIRPEYKKQYKVIYQQWEIASIEEELSKADLEALCHWDYQRLRYSQCREFYVTSLVEKVKSRKMDHQTFRYLLLVLQNVRRNIWPEAQAYEKALKEISKSNLLWEIWWYVCYESRQWPSQWENLKRSKKKELLEMLEDISENDTTSFDQLKEDVRNSAMRVFILKFEELSAYDQYIPEMNTLAKAAGVYRESCLCFGETYKKCQDLKKKVESILGDLLEQNSQLNESKEELSREIKALEEELQKLKSEYQRKSEEIQSNQLDIDRIQGSLTGRSMPRQMVAPEPVVTVKNISEEKKVRYWKDEYLGTNYKPFK